MSPARAGSIAQTVEQLGLVLFEMGAWENAAEAFEECILLRESIDTNHWLTHRVRGHYGAAIAALSQFDQAEPILLESARAIERKQDDITPDMRAREIAEARERIAAMYEA